MPASTGSIHITAHPSDLHSHWEVGPPSVPLSITLRPLPAWWAIIHARTHKRGGPSHTHTRTRVMVHHTRTHAHTWWSIIHTCTHIYFLHPFDPHTLRRRPPTLSVPIHIFVPPPGVVGHSTQNTYTHARTHMYRVGQNRIYTPYMTVYLMKSLQKITLYTPYIYGSGQPYTCNFCTPPTHTHIEL